MIKIDKNFFNFANFLSLSRMFACIPLIIFFQNMNNNLDYKIYSILVIIYIVLSDVLDGYYARRANVITDFGKIIDPLADKISFITVLIYLIQFCGYKFFIFFILLSIRDVVLLSMTLYFIIYTDYVPQANTMGKFFIFICVLMIIFHIYQLNVIIASILYILSVILLIISTIVYTKEHLSRLNDEYI